MGGRVHPLKRSVSWVNSVQRQFLAYGPILFLVPVSEATCERSERAKNKSRRLSLIAAAIKLFGACFSFFYF